MRADDGLVVVEQFLNTLDERSFNRHGSAHRAADELTSVEGLAAWLEAHDLLSPGESVDRGDLDRARSLRTALRAALTDDHALAASLADFALRLEPTGSGRLRLVASSGTAGLDAVVETVATSVADGGWKRLKLCAADDCRWAFHDTSRSGGGRWCSMEVCGNRHKTRAYRLRRSGGRSEAPDGVVVG
ncbi:CGNR zinc finger domain-containing protein [Microlunatus antarcticus]|uniref:Putative RNA-binding Zn ribbon-like protein n=1 Tax=Microlunatus antarcticus TaxID=53388 RepID=A0A7W5JV35_9ACTN|nr:CGNR zinc finger domain-containing protein [Microlunatus antarcticus]MBB3326922.1 putative RNA-binding Zn ribbon-like protein [Microlunatus antarcticus]